MSNQKTTDTQQTPIEKYLKKVICTTIAEESGDSIDFQEGHCGSIPCSSCMFSKLPKAIINACHIVMDKTVDGKQPRNLSLRSKIMRLELSMDKLEECFDKLETRCNELQAKYEFLMLERIPLCSEDEG